MKSRPRLLTTVLINIFVSALVAGTALFFYDRTHHVECPKTLPAVATVSPGSGDTNVNITGVIGAGLLAEERLVIQNAGTQEMLLTGWYITGSKGLVYTFPQLMLAPGARVQIHTAAGKDIPTDLYWGRTAPAWASGELVALYDAQAIARAFYRVP